jgi:hypothetical protein
VDTRDAGDTADRNTTRFYPKGGRGGIYIWIFCPRPTRTPESSYPLIASIAESVVYAVVSRLRAHYRHRAVPMAVPPHWTTAVSLSCHVLAPALSTHIESRGILITHWG